MNRDSKRRFGFLTVILSLLVIVLSSYLIYDKVLNSNEEENIANNNQEENENISEEDNNINEETNIDNKIILGHTLNTDLGNFVVNKDGNVYYIKNQTWTMHGTNIELAFDSEDKENLGIFGTYEVESYDPSPDNNNSFEGYKLELENIVSAYELYLGNGAITKTIMFIDKDGNVSSLTFDYTNNLEISLIKKLENYKDIVSIVPTGSYDGNGAILIDKNGNEYAYFGTN